MGHCKDCKFWRDHLAWHKPDDAGTCERPDAMWDAYQSHLDTQPEFGCIQFEAKS